MEEVDGKMGKERKEKKEKNAGIGGKHYGTNCDSQRGRGARVPRKRKRKSEEFGEDRWDSRAQEENTTKVS